MQRPASSQGELPGPLENIIGSVAKWVVFGILGIIALLIVGLVFAFHPLLLFIIIGIIAFFFLRAGDVETRYAFLAFLVIVILGFLAGLLHGGF